MDEKILDEDYEKILENSIISVVDAIIFHKGKVLLGKRTQKPAQGKWWIPGGRQKKGEDPIRAIKRKVLEETGIEVEVNKLVGVYDQIFNETAFPNVKSGVHYIARVFLVSPKNIDLEINLDGTQEAYKWVENIDENLDEYVKKSLRDSGVFYE